MWGNSIAFRMQTQSFYIIISLLLESKSVAFENKEKSFWGMKAQSLK